MTRNRLARTILPSAAVLFCLPGLAFAGAWSLSGVPASGPFGGGVMSPVVQVRFAGDGATTDAQTSISIPTGFTAAAAAANGGGCTVGGGGTFINVISSTGSIIPAGPTSFCDVTFTVDVATAAGNYDIISPAGAGSPTGCFDGGGNTVATCTDISNGTGALQVVTISPEFNINPAIANPLVFTGLISTNIDQTITVENIGDPGTNLTLTGTITGPQFSIVSGLPNNAPGIAQGASANIVVRCSSAVAGTFNDTLVLTTNDPDDGEGTVNIPVQCNVSSAPTPELEATFNAVAVADGGSVTMAAPQNTSVQQVLSFGNSGTAALSIGAVSGLSGVLSATAPSSASVAAGVTPGGAGASNITVTCNPGVTASTVQTISVVNGDGDENPFDVTIDCQAVLAAVPVVNPAAIGIVGAPSVIAAGSTTLSNTGGLQLDVSSCAVPVGFTLDAPAVVPFSVAAGGSTTVTVSCTTPAAGAPALTGDLVCQSNGLANGGVITIPLSCSGTPLVVPVMSNMGKILLASLVIGLGLLGMGLRRQG